MIQVMFEKASHRVCAYVDGKRIGMILYQDLGKQWIMESIQLDKAFEKTDIGIMMREKLMAEAKKAQVTLSFAGGENLV